ncbi:hypothetical protein ACERK3_04670 [Phycisphaerales bacterium AB-hyl4]|uniref:Cell division protein FtsL n=1 Tax=Natronomicrosphaera hydrolytica TaxID=3242702 RepID=A0ABV4U425_9BACT
MQDVNVPLILTIGVISSILLIVIVVGIQAWFHFEAMQERERKVYEVHDRELVELNTRQRNRMETYRWVDDEQQRAAVPIDQGIEMYLQRHGQ